MERQAKGKESQSFLQDEFRGAKAHDDGHPPSSNLWAHGARSIQCTSQRHVQKLEVGYGFGKDPSMPYFHSCMVFRGQTCTANCCQSRANQRVDFVEENFNVDTRRRIRQVWRKKAPMLASNPRRWNQATGPISATICSFLEAGWKPSSPGFWQTPDGSATLDGALFNKAQIVDSFSSEMEMQTWKTAARHPSSSGLEKGIITDFAKKARSQLIKEGNFMAARALDFLVCGAIHEPHLPAEGTMPNQFFFVRCNQKVLATRKHEQR